MINHLALIMDGNRRWAKKRSLFASLGHRQGGKSVEMALNYCLDKNISYLSLYAFSLENLKRSKEEVSYLFGLIDEARSKIDTFVSKGIKVCFIGDCSFLPEKTQKNCFEIEQATQQGDRLRCNILLCYGGQQEILSAVSLLVKKQVQSISLSVFKQHLWLGDIPDPDLIIRTGAVQRLSNFLLFQAAYAEIRFLDCLWPDLTEELLHATVLDAVHAQKNIGA